MNMNRHTRHVVFYAIISVVALEGNALLEALQRHKVAAAVSGITFTTGVYWLYRNYTGHAGKGAPSPKKTVPSSQSLPTSLGAPGESGLQKPTLDFFRRQKKLWGLMSENAMEWYVVNENQKKAVGIILSSVNYTQKHWAQSVQETFTIEPLIRQITTSACSADHMNRVLNHLKMPFAYKFLINQCTANRGWTMPNFFIFLTTDSLRSDPATVSLYERLQQLQKADMIQPLISYRNVILQDEASHEVD